MATSGITPNASQPTAQIPANATNASDSANRGAGNPPGQLDAVVVRSIPIATPLLDAGQVDRLKGAVAAAGLGGEWSSSMQSILHPGIGAGTPAPDAATASSTALIDGFIDSLDRLGASRRGGDQAGVDRTTQEAANAAQSLGLSKNDAQSLIDGAARYSELGPYPGGR